MVKLLLIADDFTGALDTGIQFAEYGAATKLLADAEIKDNIFYGEEADVLIVDTETRHLPRERSYQIVYHLTQRALENGVKYVYKKTDSALRGNIGSELKAVLDAGGGGFLPYVPALPSMNRITAEGIHYVNNVPIAETEFGSDPFEPVKSSAVKDLFRKQDVKVQLFPRQESYDISFSRGTIGIFDSTTEGDIKKIAAYLQSRGQMSIMAGCAGFAAVLPEMLGLRKKTVQFPVLQKQLLIACGSMNPITRRQIEYGEAFGYRRIIMKPRQQLEEGYLESCEGMAWLKEIDDYFRDNNVVMIDTGVSGKEEAERYMTEHHIRMEQARIKIAKRIGSILRKLLEKNSERTLMIIGGDTLMGFVSQTKCREITPVCEVEPGTVLSSMKINEKQIWVITKSGGFGQKDLIRTVAEKMEI